MYYIGLALLLLVFGVYLLFGDRSYLPSGKMPIDFGEYKNMAGAALIYLGIVFGWLGIKSFRRNWPE